MTAFEQLRGDMDAQVDNHLGDSISVTTKANVTTTLIGFVTASADGVSSESTDPLRQLWHVKLDKTPTNVAALPLGPASIARLSHSRAPSIVFKPAADTIDDNGGAWLFDLQKARIA